MVEDYTKGRKAESPKMGGIYYANQDKSDSQFSGGLAFVVMLALGLTLFLLFDHMFSTDNVENYTDKTIAPDNSAPNNKYIAPITPNKIKPYKANPTLKAAFKYLKGRNVPLTSTPDMPAEEEEYLLKAIELVDLGIIERAKILQWHKNGGQSDIEYKHNEIVRKLDMLDIPLRLTGFHEKLTNGLIIQDAYFQEWHETPTKPYNVKTLLAKQSHNEIIGSYYELLRVYGHDSINSTAFYQHLYTLCLD